MAESRAEPRKVIKHAVPALGLLLVLGYAAPGIASQNSPSDCAELESPGLQVPVLKLASATSVSEHQATDPDPAAVGNQPIKTTSTAPLLEAPEKSLLKYESRTLPRDTLPGDDTESTVTEKHESTDKLPEIHTSIPGVSSAELKRFKRQMYRRDI